MMMFRLNTISKKGYFKSLTRLIVEVPLDTSREDCGSLNIHHTRHSERKEEATGEDLAPSPRA